MHFQIIPGVLEKEWSSVAKQLEIIKSFTNVVHVDLIDGKFVNNRTFSDPTPFKDYSHDLFLELHMMVVDPVKFIKPFGEAGFKRFLGHVEHMTSQREFISEAKKYGEAGLALDGPTHLSAIKLPYDELDSVLVYTSNKVGFSGPPMMEDRLDKVRHIRKLSNIPIEVDGGVNDKTILRAKEAGASRFVSTSYISSSENPSSSFYKLQQIVT